MSGTERNVAATALEVAAALVLLISVLLATVGDLPLVRPRCDVPPWPRGSGPGHLWCRNPRDGVRCTASGSGQHSLAWVGSRLLQPHWLVRDRPFTNRIGERDGFIALRVFDYLVGHRRWIGNRRLRCNAGIEHCPTAAEQAAGRSFPKPDREGYEHALTRRLGQH